jgi:hypothetical protein
MSRPRERTRPSPIGVLVAVAAATFGLAVLALFVAARRDYYLAPLARQALDPRHATLRSSGRVGLLFGAVAASLVVVNLAYLVRRRFAAARWLGSLRAWMDVHVVTGLLAAGFASVHSAFHLRSAVGSVAVVALLVVVATGVVGRWVHSRIPRTREGRELELDEALARFEEIRREVAELGVPPLAFGPAAADGVARPWLPVALVRLLVGDAAARRELLRRRTLLRERVSDRATLRRLEPLLVRAHREAQALARLRELSGLMASWRFLHRWLALVMVGAAACHVALALRYAGARIAELLP